MKIAVYFEERAYTLGFAVVERRLDVMKTRLAELEMRLESEANGCENGESTIDAALARAKGGILSLADCRTISFVTYSDDHHDLLFRVSRKMVPYLRKHYEINPNSDECFYLSFKMFQFFSFVTSQLSEEAKRNVAEFEWAAALHLAKLYGDRHYRNDVPILLSIYRSATNGIIAEQRKDIRVLEIAQYALLLAEAGLYFDRQCFAVAYDAVEHRQRKGAGNSTGVLVCSGCRQVRYCCAECQKKCWPIHKLVCKAFPTCKSSGTFMDAFRMPELGKEMMAYFDFIENRMTPSVV